MQPIFDLCKRSKILFFLRQKNICTEFFSEGEAFLIKGFELRHITADAIDLHRALRTDADDFTPVLHTFNEVELFVVGLHMMTENNTQTGILFIEQTGHLEVWLC